MIRTIGDSGQWWRDDGDNTLRLNYSLNKDSVVFDLGGYDGWFIEQINNRYGSKIFCFEPIKEYSLPLEVKFGGLDNIKIFSLAISDKNGRGIIFFNDIASSFHIKSNKSFEIDCATLDKIMNDYGINNIDLIKINVEGEEYSILEHMIKNDLIKKCVNIQVQFHIVVENYEKRYMYIKSELEKTHHLTYRYPFVWENWKCK